MDFPLPGGRVAAVLERLAATRGLLRAIMCDNRSKSTSEALDESAFKCGVMLEFIEPGKPTQNASIESFDDTFRDECLNENWLLSLADAQFTIEAWRVDYETERPHSKLRDRTPHEFALHLSSATASTIIPTGLN